MWRGLKWVKIYRGHKEPRHSGIKVRDETDRGKGGLGALRTCWIPLTGMWNSVNSVWRKEVNSVFPSDVIGYGRGSLKSGRRLHSSGLVKFRRCLNVVNY